MLNNATPKLTAGWHCKAFAPTWTELAEKKAYHEKLTGFHMAQVNCIAQGGALLNSH